MEYVKVAFPTDRFVYIDGDKGGITNQVLRVDAGTHGFDLGNLANYKPATVEVEVKETTVLLPMLVVFTKKGK